MLLPFATLFSSYHKPVSIRRDVFRLSMPVLLSSLFQRLVSIVDVFLTGGLGAAAIAAAGLGQLLMFTTMTVFWGLSTGTTVVISHLWGAGRRDDAGRAALVACLACLLMTLVSTCIGTAWGGDIARLMGASSDVQALAADYIRLVFLWMVWTTGLNVLSAIMHGAGDTRTPMEAIILVNILHVLLAWPLIYGKFGLPQLGVKGAAIAINCSEFVGFSYLLFQAIRKKHISFSRPDFPILGRIWKVGWPVALERIAHQSGQLFYSSFILSLIHI